ncbi:hypothetical protein ABW20_dc0110082 [Dactylellina cionopaga]|nr:hypothetical protein ABW20_dc0110082 [Dactylellina cionopaga]
MIVHISRRLYIAVCLAFFIIFGFNYFSSYELSGPRNESYEVLRETVTQTIFHTAAPTPITHQPSDSHFSSPEAKVLDLNDDDDDDHTHTDIDITNNNNEDDLKTNWCNRVGGRKYIEDVAGTWTLSCAPSPERAYGSVVCFQAELEQEPDNFCVIRNALYKPSQLINDTQPKAVDEVDFQPETPWLVSCDLKTQWDEGVQAIQKFRAYFSDTGAGAQLAEFELAPWNVPSEPELNPECEKHIMLVKLEGGGNIWHTLMEVWSAVLTMDILALAGGAREELGLSEKDLEGSNVQVYMSNMDSEKKASPIFDLWRMVTGAQPKKAEKLAPGCYKSVILPFAGGANPFWKDHWKERRNCKRSSLLDGFVDKVLGFYGVSDTDMSEPEETDDEKKIQITIISRTNNRKIVNLKQYIPNLQAKYPQVSINTTSFEHLKTAEQLRLVRQTDILIGVTGAGLTHSMFLKEGSAVVELMQPEPFVYFGFRNLVRMRRVEYHVVHGTKIKPGDGNWQVDDVLVDENGLEEVIGKAIEGLKRG